MKWVNKKRQINFINEIQVNNKEKALEQLQLTMLLCL